MTLRLFLTGFLCLAITVGAIANDVAIEKEVIGVADVNSGIRVKFIFSVLFTVVAALVIAKKLVNHHILKGNNLKGEIWDNIHYALRHYSNGVVHSCYTYDFRLDRDIALRAFDCILKNVPVLHSSFHVGFFASHWSVTPYNIEDAVLIKEVPESEAQSEQDKFLCSEIPFDSPLQMKALVLYHGNKTTVCTNFPHMVLDGGSHGYLLRGFCSIYNKLAAGETVEPVKMGDRSFSSIYADMTPATRRKAKLLWKIISTKDATTVFPFTPKADGDHPMIIRHKIGSDFVARIQSAGKKYGASVNDILLAVYFHSLYEMAEFKDSQKTSIFCAIDLRRHLAEKSRESVTNHTTWLQCSVPKKGVTVLETLEHVKASIASFKGDPFIGLHGMPQVGTVFDLLPRAVAEFMFNMVYDHPFCAISNVGRINLKGLSLLGHEPVDGFQTGYVGYKPYIVVTVTSIGDHLNLTTPIRGNEKDREIVHQFFEKMVENANILCEEIDNTNISFGSE